LNKSLIILLTLLIGSFSTLSSAPLGATPQLNKQASQSERRLGDGLSIILGKHKNRQAADSQLNSLLDFMDSSSKVVNLELAHGFDYAITEKDSLYVVSIEPFLSDSVLQDVLVTVKTHYPKAVAGVCTKCVREDMVKSIDPDQEVLDNAIALKNSSKRVEVRVEADVTVDEFIAKEKTSESMLDSFKLPFKIEYLFYGVGAFALLLLVFLVMRKPKKSSDKEMREMYAQAKRLEDEMGSETQSKPSVHEEEVVTVAPVTPKVQSKPAPQPAAQPTPKSAPQPTPTPKPEPTPVPVAEPERDLALNHKLRGPNMDIGTISKDSFNEFEGLRLLIAEDNLINQKVIVGLLKDSGINIMIANDGQECLEILAEDPNYPIILMDAHMPRIDGLEATRQIRANPAYDHITVMALSGDTGSDDVRKMRDSGMEEQLEKPLKIAALYQALYCYFDPSTVGGAEDDLPEIHLDNSLGLEMLGGDVELYHEILSEFQSLYHDSDEKIELWIKDGDHDRAKALLLDVKGIGESIGTAELTQTSEEFREALIANETAQYVRLLKLYRSQLKSILADIAEV